MMENLLPLTVMREKFSGEVKMKILLIQPGKSRKTIGGDDYFIYEPLGLEYLASGVKESHNVKIFESIYKSR